MFNTTGSGLKNGTIAFGNVEGIIFAVAGVNNGNGNNTDTMSCAITGAGGLTKGGSGKLILTGVNTITGKTHVSGGILQVGDGTANSSIGDGNVTVDAGALLDIRDNAAAAGSSINYIKDSATLDLVASGLLNGKLNINNGIETVGSLNLGGVAEGGGYFGSSAAAAANPTLTVNVSDTYFSGNGLVQVVPEPSTVLAAVAVAGLTLMRRRHA
jgi:autotransporter-associated beta strand protein